MHHKVGCTVQTMVTVKHLLPLHNTILVVLTTQKTFFKTTLYSPFHKLLYTGGNLGFSALLTNIDTDK